VTRTNPAYRAAATLEAPALHRAGRAEVQATGTDLTLTACVVPWNVAAEVTDDGRSFYTESWGPGSLIPDDMVVIYDGHVPGGDGRGGLNRDRVPIGRASGFDDRDDGLYATLTLANTSRGRDVYELARTLGYVHVSLEADVETGPSGGTVGRTAARPSPLTGLAIVLPPGRGAYPGAMAAAGRAQADPPDDDDDDSDDDEPNPDIEPDAPAPAGRANVEHLVRQELARYGMTAQRERTVAAGPFARFNSFAQVMVEARESGRRQVREELSAQFAAAYRAHAERNRLMVSGIGGRALVDQITADNPGVLPPTWLSEVFGIVDQGRPASVALGIRSAGSSGMEIDWPYYDGDLSVIVAQQLAEKTAINSVKVSIKRASQTLETYAGGSDVSYQLIRRSSPAYLGLYDRILQIAYGLTTESAFAVALSAGAGAPALTYDAGTDDDGAAVKAVLFAASARVKAATGSPASVALAASDVYAALGGMAWLQPPQYGTQNTAGTASAATLRINISGLEIVEAPALPDGEVIVTNPGAAGWFEDGPFLVTAEDVEKLGRDVAIWGMGTPGIFLPAGVVKITVTVPPPIALAASSSKSK
jgi:hypothetical protein